MKKKVSLKDIAQAVGVSTALVSYVLNNKQQGRISEESARRIRETAKALNYRTNLIARSLKTNKTHTIGLVIADISNPFFARLARLLEDEAEKKDYTVIIGSSDENPDKFARLLDTFRDKQVDGLILAAGAACEPCIRELVDQSVPFVLVDRYFPDMKTNFVALHNYNAAFKAVSHLLERGYRRPALITYQTRLHNITERKRGFRAACKAAAITVPPQAIRELAMKNSLPEIQKAVDAVLKAPLSADAILFASNALAVQAVKYINSLDIKVPQELGLVGFDETEALDLFYAPLTFIRQPLEEMAAQALDILLNRIDRNNMTTQVNIEGELVIRQST